jgi:hypothetical protein
MNCVRKRNLILITALVYTIFACNYVLLCKRNIRVLNLVECFNLLSAKPNADVPLLLKGPSHQNTPVSTQFLSRPRVIITRIASPDFSVVAITFLLLFTFLVKKEQFFLLINTPFSIDTSPDIISLRSLRI